MTDLVVTSYMTGSGLTDWWQCTFSDQERSIIDAVFADYFEQESMYGDPDVFLKPGTPRVVALSNLAQLSAAISDRSTYDLQKSVAYRFVVKAATFHDASPTERHHALNPIIVLLYWNREIYPEALELAIGACQQQISIAPTVSAELKRTNDQLGWHKGFEQLAIIRERERNFEEAMHLASEAKAQGWPGDWDKRIQRCQQRLAKRK